MGKKRALASFLLIIVCLIYHGTASAQMVQHKFSEDGKLIAAEPLKEEKLSDPLVDEEVTLIPISQDNSIFLSQDRKSLVVLGKVCLREGMLEFLVCSKNSKEHESIIATKTKPSLIHVGLLAMGAEPGKPAQFTPKFVAASGPRIDITFRWLDKDGKQQEAKAEEWVQEVGSKTQMSSHWVFTGSMFRRLEGNKNQYMADVTGEIVSVSNFPAAVLDVPIESSNDNSDLLFQAFSEKIPPVGTSITMILQKREKQSDKQSSSDQ